MQNNSMKFKIGLISFIKPGILPFFIFLFFVIAFVPLIAYSSESEKQMIVWIVAIVWIGFIGLPPIVLHINYYLHDRNRCIEINVIKQYIVLTKRNTKLTIKFDEIDRIEKYHSKNQEESFIPKMHWHTFYYYKIVLKDKKPVYISRMTLEKFEKRIEGINFKFIKVFYPIIKEERNC